MVTVQPESKSRSQETQKGDKLWLIKYALTTGIEEIVVESVDGAQIKPENSNASYELGRDLFPTWNEAEKAAQDVLRKKVIAIERQLLSLRKLKFTPR